MSIQTLAAKRRRKFAPLVAVAGLAATLVLALSTSGVLAGFTASITNNANSVGSGTLLMSEGGTAETCFSSSGATVTTANANTSCTNNALNGTTVAVPGASYTSTLTIKNDGSIPASTFTLAPGACTAATHGTKSGNGLADFCSKVNVTINNDTTSRCVFPASTTTACTTPTSANTLSSLNTGGTIALATPVAPGATVAFTFTVQVDQAGSTNDHQGLKAAQSLTWSFAS